MCLDPLESSGRLHVSVVVPAFNEEAVLSECLSGLIAQTIPADEILVIDNGSTDATAGIVRRFQDQYPDRGVRLLTQAGEPGLVPTRNLGLDQALGDIIGRIDADSRLAPDWVERVSAVFGDPDVAAVTGPVCYYDLPFRQVGLRVDDLMRRLLLHIAPAQCRFLFGSNMAVRRQAWELIRAETCRDENDLMHEDIDLALHLAGRGLLLSYEPTMIATLSARRLEDHPRDFLHYITRFDRTYAAHNLHRKRLKAPTLLFLTIYLPAKATRNIYQYLQATQTTMQGPARKAHHP